MSCKVQSKKKHVPAKKAFQPKTAAVTSEKIKTFECAYKGSEDEREDIIKAYNCYGGNMDCILSNILCASIDDEPRIRRIIERLIKDKVLCNKLAFRCESADSKRKRHARYAYEATLACKEEKDVKKTSCSHRPNWNAFVDHIESTYVKERKPRCRSRSVKKPKTCEKKVEEKRPESCEPKAEEEKSIGAGIADFCCNMFTKLTQSSENCAETSQNHTDTCNDKPVKTPSKPEVSKRSASAEHCGVKTVVKRPKTGPPSGSCKGNEHAQQRARSRKPRSRPAATCDGSKGRIKESTC